MQHIFEYLINRKLTAKDANKNRIKKLSDKTLCLEMDGNTSEHKVVSYEDTYLNKIISEDEFVKLFPADISDDNDMLNNYDKLHKMYYNKRNSGTINSGMVIASVTKLYISKFPKVFEDLHINEDDLCKFFIEVFKDDNDISYSIFTRK